MTKFYECQCRAHAVSVDDEPLDYMLILNFWNRYHAEWNFFNRIKEGVRMIINGKPLIDDIVLSFEDAQSLAKDIQEAVKKGGSDI